MSSEVTVVHATNGNAMMLNKEVFEQAYRAARLFSASKLVPVHFQGKEADCFIGLMVANRMGEDPLTVLQNMFVVHGRPGWSTQYMIARANASGVFKGRIVWETKGSGENLSVTARATLADTGEAVEVSADMKMAKAEGWTKSSKYNSMPEHMLRWRSAAFLIRLYCPEVMLGYQTVEEIETMPPMKDVTPKEDSITSNINEMIRKAEEAAQSAEETPEPEAIEQQFEQAADQVLQEQESVEQEQPALTLEELTALPEKTVRDIETKAKQAIRTIEAGADKIAVFSAIQSETLVKRLKDMGRGSMADKLLAA